MANSVVSIFDSLPQSQDNDGKLILHTNNGATKSTETLGSIIAEAIGNFGSFATANSASTEPIGHPDILSPSKKIIYLVKDETVTGQDQYREWINTTDDTWEMIGDTSIEVFSPGTDIKIEDNIISVNTNGEIANSGQMSFVAGSGTFASGYGSVAVGVNTTASAHRGAFAEGENTFAGYDAHAEVYSTSAIEANSHAEGSCTYAGGYCSHAEGYSARSIGTNSHAEGYCTIAVNGNSHSEGSQTTAYYGHAEGYKTFSNAEGGHAEGWETTANGSQSHSENYQTNAVGSNSHAEGFMTTAADGNSHTEGYKTLAGYNCHAEGSQTSAVNSDSHSEGYATMASGSESHAEGYMTSALGRYSHTEGYGTIASGESMHAGGSFNETTANALFVIGNGSAKWVQGTLIETRSDAFVIDNSGKATANDFVANNVSLSSLYELANLIINKPSTDKVHLVCENGVLKWELLQESIAVNNESISVNDEPIGF